MHRHKKASRSVLFEIRWFDGRHAHLVQVRGEKQQSRMMATLAALPWVSMQEVRQLRR